MSNSDAQKVVIIAVGDIMLGDSRIKIGHGVRSYHQTNSYHDIFSEISKTLQNGDIVFGNLETVLSDIGIGKSISSRSYRGSPLAIEALKHAGFTILNMANNHTMDHGFEAFEETRDLLYDNNILPIGLLMEGVNKNLVIIIINGNRIGFLGYSLLPEIHSAIIPYAKGTEESIMQAIQMAKNDVEYLVLSLHWGAEHIDHPSPAQIKMARKFVNAGADVILGHHSHMVQGIEKYKNGIICYSLGNFVFDKHQEALRKTYIVKIYLGSLAIEHEIIPLMTDSNFRPIPMSEEKKSEFKRYIEELSRRIENDDLADFQRSLEEYNKLTDEIRKVYQKSLRTYFVRNLGKYSIKDAFSILMNTIPKGSIRRG